MTREQWLHLLARARDGDEGALVELLHAEDSISVGLQAKTLDAVEQLAVMLEAMEEFDPERAAPFGASMREHALSILTTRYELVHHTENLGAWAEMRELWRRIGLDSDSRDRPDTPSKEAAPSTLDGAREASSKD